MRPLTSKCVFGKWLRDAMIDQDINERELAEALGVHYVSISYHLNGKRRPSFQMLKKYADYFGVDLIDLYEMTIVGENG